MFFVACMARCTSVAYENAFRVCVWIVPHKFSVANVQLPFMQAMFSNDSCVIVWTHLQIAVHVSFWLFLFEWTRMPKFTTHDETVTTQRKKRNGSIVLKFSAGCMNSSPNASFL